MRIQLGVLAALAWSLTALLHIAGIISLPSDAKVYESIAGKKYINYAPAYVIRKNYSAGYQTTISTFTTINKTLYPRQVPVTYPARFNVVIRMTNSKLRFDCDISESMYNQLSEGQRVIGKVADYNNFITNSSQCIDIVLPER
ncbi:hypothetical protein [Vibrio sp. D431a]|uniref:hypothetical protein n=1 Tax=Vibrio sp. D431a TaxID=2837388 RepID=UPI002557C32E|nr:hypothetical protein [Vibrio sp. D431a]MDK9793341.1 hypothetical protein [Vibrio sp. D431a]